MHLFARPYLLWLVVLVPALAVLLVWRQRQQTRAWLQLGLHDSITTSSAATTSSRGRIWVAWLFVYLLCLIGCAGPQWGRGDAGVAVGRDIVVILDLSKSMLADDMRAGEPAAGKERWLVARASLHDWLDHLKAQGGHRVGLVVFAVKPWIVCPLTSDYDHVAMRLDEFTPSSPPPEITSSSNEDYPSGTRIGSAIIAAVNLHDSRFPGFQDCLLLSDGDDPATDAPAEIDAGIAVARTKNIPIHTIGLGDPDNALTITWRQPDGKEEILGPTRLFEKPLQDIARLTHGIYLPARREKPDLVDFFRQSVLTQKKRELADDALPQYRDRSILFFLPALTLVMVALYLEYHSKKTRRSRPYRNAPT